MAGESSELVGSSDEGGAGELRNGRGDPLAELRVSVESRADRGPTCSELVEAGKDEGEAVEIGVELTDVATELLSERERHRIHEVGTPDLGDLRECHGLGVQSVAQRRDRWDEPVGHLAGRGDVHGGREGVVR